VKPSKAHQDHWQFCGECHDRKRRALDNRAQFNNGFGHSRNGGIKFRGTRAINIEPREIRNDFMISAFTVFSLPALNAHIVIGFNVDPVVHACDVRQVNGTIKQCGVGDIARLYRAAQKIFTVRQGVERQADCWPASRS
jgi:hypothetical protein